MISRPTGT